MLASEGLNYMSAHLLPRRRSWFRDGRTCSMVRAGREVRSRMDYILGMDSRLFWNVSVWDPRNKPDHYLVMGCLHSTPLREYSKYLGRRKGLPLRPPATPTRENGIFTALQRAFLKPQTQDTRKNAWISEATWRLVTERVSARRDTTKN